MNNRSGQLTVSIKGRAPVSIDIGEDESDETIASRVAELVNRLRRDEDEDEDETGSYGKVTTEDPTPPATTAPAVAGYMHTYAPPIPRPRKAGEVLPPEQRATWARARTPHDK